MKKVLLSLSLLLALTACNNTGKTSGDSLDNENVECEEFRYDEHFTFVETLPATVGKRNPKVFSGKYITITRKDDGSRRPNFKPIKNWTDFNAEEFAVGVANELLWALEGVTVPNVPINF